MGVSISESRSGDQENQSVTYPCCSGGAVASSIRTFQLGRPLSASSRGSYVDKDRRSSEVDSWDPFASSEAPVFLRAFSKQRGPRMELFRFSLDKLSLKAVKAWWAAQNRELSIISQSYIEERHNVLGSDLATAHFIVYRGGKVKFSNGPQWYELDKATERCPQLPNKFDPSFYLEALDASNTELRYEGLANVISLSQLKWLSVENCQFVDDWFIDRLTGELGPTLEYLNLSGCREVTENVLSCFYRCPRLKELRLANLDMTPTFKLGCLLLEEALSGLTVTGVDYSSGQEPAVTEPLSAHTSAQVHGN